MDIIFFENGANIHHLIFRVVLIRLLYFVVGVLGSLFGFVFEFWVCSRIVHLKTALCGKIKGLSTFFH